MKAQNIILVMLFASLLLMIQSCGGGNGNDDNNPLLGDTPPSGQLNGGLKGYFLWSSGGRNERLDLSTGRWRKIPVIQDWKEKNEDMDNIDDSDSLTRFLNNGRFALKLINDCDLDAASLLNSEVVQCIAVFDLDSQSVISEFRLGPIVERSMDSIALSDDGQYIAILDNNNYDYYRVRIYDLGGNEIDESLYSERLNDEFVKIDSIEWLSDGRLIFAYGPTIMRSVDPLSTSARPLKVFLPSQGEPIHLRVSPDGTKIAYALKTDSTLVSLDSTLWVMDVDGSNAYQLVEFLDNNINIQPEMNNPAWSQDGKWIAFQFGGVDGVSPTNPGVPSGLLVIPSDGVKEPIDYDGVSKFSPDDVIRIFSYYTPGRDDWSVADDHRLRDSFPEGRVTWVMP